MFYLFITIIISLIVDFMLINYYEFVIVTFSLKLVSLSLIVVVTNSFLEK